MTDETTASAATVLERIRQETDAESVPAQLVKRIYELEHSRQFEVERGPIRAQIRDLIKAAAEAEG